VNISWANREFFIALFAYVGESRIIKIPINKLNDVRIKTICIDIMAKWRTTA